MCVRQLFVKGGCEFFNQILGQIPLNFLDSCHKFLFYVVPYL